MVRNSLHQEIVAAPTGGACGIIPGVLAALDESYAFSLDEKIDALLCAALIGLVINTELPISGAAKGCQAETGVGAAMAAQLLGGTSADCIHAAALALKNSLGIVCDPVAGRVSTPCIKRNAFKAGEAIIAAWMAIHSVRSFISPAAVVGAASTIGEEMHEKYKETSLGGLALTPEARDQSDVLSSDVLIEYSRGEQLWIQTSNGNNDAMRSTTTGYKINS